MEIKNQDDRNKTARIAGILYIFPWVLSFLAVILRGGIIIPGDYIKTAQNIQGSGLVWNLSILSDLVVQVVFIFLVIYLYKIFHEVNKNMSLWMVILFLVSVPISMFNTVNLVAAQLFASGNGLAGIFSTEQLASLVNTFLILNESGMMIAYIFWGLWLFPLGYLAFKSNFIPRWIGVYVIIGCFGYLFDFAIYFLLPELNISINMFTGWGELFMCLWLLVKGVSWVRPVSKI